MPWVLVEQDEGYMVHVQYSKGVRPFFVDYSEAKENEDYVAEKIEELEEIEKLFPADLYLRTHTALCSYLPAKPVWYLRHRKHEDMNDIVIVGPVPESLDIDDVLNSDTADLWSDDGDLDALPAAEVHRLYPKSYINPWSLWEEK